MWCPPSDLKNYIAEHKAVGTRISSDRMLLHCKENLLPDDTRVVDMELNDYDLLEVLVKMTDISSMKTERIFTFDQFVSSVFPTSGSSNTVVVTCPVVTFCPNSGYTIFPPDMVRLCSLPLLFVPVVILPFCALLSDELHQKSPS